MSTDGRARICGRCGAHVAADEAHDDQCQIDTNARGVAAAKAQIRPTVTHCPTDAQET